MGETIMRVWISDPTRIVLDSDTPLCDKLTPPSDQSPQTCAVAATVLRVRPLGKRIPLEYNAPDKTRLENLIYLTVVTITDTNRRSLYHFALKLTPETNVPTSVEVVPDSAMPILPPIPRWGTA